MNVLLIEDEPKIRYALERWLSNEGHTMCWAATAAGGLALLRTEKIDCIILDMVLGDGVDGWGVLRERLDDHALAGVPLIVMSALDAAQIHARASVNLLEGTRIILGKPPDLNLLRKALEVIEGTKGQT